MSEEDIKLEFTEISEGCKQHIVVDELGKPIPENASILS
jgi:hypothetical protein